MNPRDRLVRRMLARWCSPETMARIIDAVLADTAYERRCALAEARQWRARLASLRGMVALCRVVMLQALHAAAGFESAPHARARQGFRVGALSMVVSTALLATLPFVDAYTHHRGSDFWLLLCLLPSALPIGLTVLPVVATLWSGSRDHGGRQTAGGLWGVALACSVVTVLVLAWLTPMSNQAFRQAFFTTSPDVLRGVSELTLSELVSVAGGGLAPADLMTSETPAKATLALHLRGAVALAPVVFTFAAIGIAAQVRAAAVVRLCGGMFALALYAGWWFGIALIDGPERHYLVAAWTPLLTALGAGLISRVKPLTAPV
jgi:hypothetical protein